MGHALHGIARDGGVGGDHSVHAMALQGAGNHPDLYLVQIGSNLHKNRDPAFGASSATCVWQLLVRQPLTPLGNGSQQSIQCFVALQSPQVLRVGRADIDGHVIGMRVYAIQARKIVAGGIFDGRAGVFANVQPQQHGCCAMLLAELSPLHVVDECIKALIVEPQAVDQCTGLGQSEHARLGVAWLGLGGDGTHLHKAKAHGAQGVDAPGIFIQPGSHSHPIRKTQTGQFHRVVHTRLAPGPLQRGSLPLGQHVHGQVVRGLRVHAKQKGAGEGVGDEGHGTIIEELPSIFSHDDTFLTHPRRTQDPGRPSRVAIRGARRHRGRGHGLHRQQVH